MARQADAALLPVAWARDCGPESAGRSYRPQLTPPPAVALAQVERLRPASQPTTAPMMPPALSRLALRSGWRCALDEKPCSEWRTVARTAFFPTVLRSEVMVLQPIGSLPYWSAALTVWRISRWFITPASRRASAAGESSA